MIFQVAIFRKKNKRFRDYLFLIWNNVYLNYFHNFDMDNIKGQR